MLSHQAGAARSLNALRAEGPLVVRHHAIPVAVRPARRTPAQQRLRLEYLETKPYSILPATPMARSSRPTVNPVKLRGNHGQTAAQVDFLSGSGYSLFLTPTESVLDLRNLAGGPRRGRSSDSVVLTSTFVSANPPAAGGQPRPARRHRAIT